MASITFAVDEKLKSEISKFVWINLSELVRQELLEQQKTRKAFERFKKIISKSKFTEQDAKELSEKVKLSMHNDLKKKGLV